MVKMNDISKIALQCPDFTAGKEELAMGI